MTIIVLSAGPIQLLLGLPVPDSIELFATRRIWKAKWHSLLFFLSPLSIIFPSFSWVPNSFHSFRRKGKTGCRRLKKRCSFLFFFFSLPFHLQADESMKYEDKSAPSSGQGWMFTSRYSLLLKEALRLRDKILKAATDESSSAIQEKTSLPSAHTLERVFLSSSLIPFIYTYQRTSANRAGSDLASGKALPALPLHVPAQVPWTFRPSAPSPMM